MSSGFTMYSCCAKRRFPCLDDGLHRNDRKVVCTILHIGCEDKHKINFTEDELFFIKAITNNLKTWKEYSDQYEDEVKRGVRKGVNCWVYQKELMELLFTYQFTEADRVLQKFKEYAVEEMEDTSGKFTTYSRSTGTSEVFDASTDGGYLEKANFFRDFINDYEEHLSFYKQDERPRQLTESILMKTYKLIKDSVNYEL
jgi:hypothetical protein